MQHWRKQGTASWAWRGVLALALVTTLGAGSAIAKKPVPSDPAPTLSGRLVCGDGAFTMTPDGSDIAPLDFSASCVGFEGSVGVISRERHKGQLWRLQTCVVGGDEAVDGVDHEELFVIREGEDGLAVQLTENPNMVFSYYSLCTQWGPGDAFVSWVAHVVDEGEIVEAGIFAAPLLYDADGDIVGLADTPDLVVSVGTRVLGNGSTVTHVRSGHDWSPDGTKVVWNHISNGLYITDIDDPTVHTWLTGGIYPVWSSRDQIAFGGDTGIKRIESDGTDETLIMAPLSGRMVDLPVWSPDGTHIAYLERKRDKSVKFPYVYIHTICTTPVDGPRRTSTGISGIACRWLDE